MAASGIALGLLTLFLWVAGLPVPGLDWLAMGSFAVAGVLSALAYRRGAHLGLVGLLVNGVGLILLVLVLTY
jgi:hypothetical protein